MAVNKTKSAKPSRTRGIDIRAVVLAGGSGTRFWPLSRQRSPKQFLKIISDKPLIEETVDRIKGLVPNSRIYPVAISSQTRILRRRLPWLPEKNFLVEPEARNTAASLMLATAAIYLENPEAVVIVLPADHFIGEVKAFREKLRVAAGAAYECKKIVMFGILPTSPATSYGYIHISSEHRKKVNGEKFYRVKGFREKPDLPSALEFIQSGDYYWNSGIFLWRADTFEENLREFAPELFSAWIKLLPALRRHDRREIARVFREIPALSIDYALIEKVSDLLMNHGNFGWSDLGSWGSLYEYLPKDEACNSSRDRLLTLKARNCLVLNPGKLTALIGVEDLIVINSGDALLICKRDHDQMVKELVEKLKKDLPEYV